MAELKAQAVADLQDNNTGAISPADVRNMITEFLDTMTPAYGALTIGSGAGIALTLNTTPAVALPWETISPDTTPEYTCTLATGIISRTGQTANRVTINVECYCAAGKYVTAQLFNAGTALPWRTTVLGQGATKPININLTAIIRASALSLQVMVNADANNTAVTFKNGAFYVANVPVVGSAVSGVVLM